MRRFIRDSGKPAWLRVEDIQAVFPTDDGCVVRLRGAIEDGPYLIDSAEAIVDIIAKWEG
jgi:hypothetical protein